MTETLRLARLFVCAAALLSVASLAGCIDSAEPLLTDAQPLLGERPSLQLFALRDGAAYEPTVENFTWKDVRYVRLSGSADGIGDFTLHRFEGNDLLLQSIRHNLPAEYAVARKLADGTYLVVAIDESEADEATRRQFCSTEKGAACRVATREAVLAFARSTAAKPHSTGGLAVLLGEP
jgi:hypothetical protein